jgi:hypothetical protein
MSDKIRTRLKCAAVVCLAIPLVIIVMLGIGEIASGTLSGLQHLGQLAPIVALGWLGWTRPWLGGLVLVGLALLLAGLYIGFGGSPPFALIINAALLFAPPLLAGVLFLAAGRRRRQPAFADHGGAG